MVKSLEDIKDLINNLKEGDSLEKTALNLKSYQDGLLPHLKDEEDRCLPLTRAYFTAEELNPIIMKIVGSGPKVC